MSLTANEQHDDPTASTRRWSGPRRPGAWGSRASLLAAALLSTGMLAAACSSGSSGPGVASAGKATATTGPSALQSANPSSLEDNALAYINCMRTHGEPNMPDPVVGAGGAHITINASSGVDPNSPQFTTANNTCKHLLPTNGAPQGNSITAAEQADYLKATACMRSHGVPNFPDPTFQNNTVTFTNTTPIDTTSPQYTSALATCQKLIPAGLPYSTTMGQ